MNLIFKMLKFGIVGFIGMLWDFLITFLLKEKLKINKYVANSIGFTCAVINNFILNLYWTFQVSGNTTNFFIRFVLISIIGLGLNNFFVWLFNDKLGTNFYVAKALAVVCVFAWNFCANNYFNFGA
jgi:putative flippase GtrA